MSGKKINDSFAGWIAFVGGLLTITSSIAAFFYPTPWPWPFITVAVLQLIVLGAMVWVMVTAMRHNYRAKPKYDKALAEVSQLKDKMKDELAIKEDVAKILHNYCHGFRKIATDIFNAEQSDGVDYDRELKEFFMKMLSNIKEAFDVYTGHSCATCVKLLNGDNVTTYLRDEISGRERSRVDHSPSLIQNFHYSLNTAFKTILSGSNPAVYYCNDLLKEKDHYENANPEWPKHYTATLVAPIRYVRNENTGESAVLGFICVDNKGGGFNDTAVNILGSFADLSFFLMNLISAKRNR